VVEPVVANKAEVKTDIFASFFGSATAKPIEKNVEEKKVVPLVVTKAQMTPKSLQQSVPKVQKSVPKEILMENPMTEALNSFFGTGKKATPLPPPEPKVVETKSPPKQKPFSFFQAAPAKPTPQVVSKPSPVPPRKSPTLTLKKDTVVEKIEEKSPGKPAPAFSFFKLTSSPEPAPIVPKPAPVPVRKPSPTRSLFKAREPATSPPESPVVETKKSVKGSGTFSLFGGGPKAVAPAPQAPVVVEKKKVVQRSGTFSLFSSPGTQTIAKAPVAEKKAVQKQTIAIAAPKKVATVADNIPVISKFKQNADGSITGIVSNSKNFRTGTEITTSPVPRGAKAGSVVTTSSGSKYRLQ